MILEMAVLQVKPGRAGEFQDAFRAAEPIIAASTGYLGHGHVHAERVALAPAQNSRGGSGVRRARIASVRARTRRSPSSLGGRMK